MINIKNRLYLYSTVIAVAFFIASYVFLKLGHFHEDAYILFIYVENMINGNGITYYPAGGPIEGATDFLWMILLFLISNLGLDVGTASVLLNSLGVFLISCIITSEVSLIEKDSFFKKAAFIFFPIAWIGQSYLVAASGGFSVFFYVSIVALIFYYLYKEINLLSVPILSLLLGLVRPDGVILGFGFVLLGLILSYKIGRTKKYLYYTVVAAILGVSYFLWRYYYFGNLLPLPLYVKSGGGLLSGAVPNFKWLVRHGGFIYLSVVIFISIYLNSLKRSLFLLIPFVIFFLALTAATQSQNVGYRFQAPLFIILYLLIVFLVVKLINEYQSTKEKLFEFSMLSIIYLCSVFLTANSLTTFSSMHYLLSFNYINEFPLRLKNVLKNKTNKNITITLTEAGRLAYWNQSENVKIIDLVGLNTVYPAKNDIDTEYIGTLNPDIIMYHHAGRLSFEEIADNSKIIILKNNDILSERLNVKEPSSKVARASHTSSSYLYDKFNDYDVIAVDYTEDFSYSHIYAVRKDLSLTEDILGELDSIFKEKIRKSYYEMKSVK